MNVQAIVISYFSEPFKFAGFSGKINYFCAHGLRKMKQACGLCWFKSNSFEPLNDDFN